MPGSARARQYSFLFCSFAGQRFFWQAHALLLAEGLGLLEADSLQPKRITVMTYNIHFGVGVDFVYDLDRIADLIAEEGRHNRPMRG